MVRFTLRQLSFISETARLGGIAQAARHLHVSPSAIASAIDKLESMSGLIVFDRFPAQGMRLTRTGMEFVAQSDALLKQADALDRHAVELAEGRSGVISIGTHYALAHQVVLPAVVAHRTSHPHVRIEVMEDDYEAMLIALDAGEVDALIVFDQVFDAANHLVEVLMELPPLVLLPAAHELMAKTELDLEDLADIPYIAVSRAGPGPSYLQLLQAAGLNPEVPLASQSREMVQAYVGKGLGFTLVGFPPKQNTTIEGDKVGVRPITQDIGTFRAVLARSRYARPTPLLNGFLDLCRQQC
jgi:DNA-binding transcriptional LysR family regulator